MEEMHLRELLEAHHSYMNHRLDRLEAKVDQLGEHTHQDKVGWFAFATILVAALGTLTQVAF